MIKTFDYEKTHINNVLGDILGDAVIMKASKIHIEPNNEYLNVIFNINDKSVKYTTIPNVLKRVLYTRIKIVFGLDITESKLEQHGILKANLREKDVNFNVSFILINNNQKIIIDVLN